MMEDCNRRGVTSRREGESERKRDWRQRDAGNRERGTEEGRDTYRE